MSALVFPWFSEMQRNTATFLHEKACDFKNHTQAQPFVEDFAMVLLQMLRRKKTSRITEKKETRRQRVRSSLVLQQQLNRKWSWRKQETPQVMLQRNPAMRPRKEKVKKEEVRKDKQESLLMKTVRRQAARNRNSQLRPHQQTKRPSNLQNLQSINILSVKTHPLKLPIAIRIEMPQYIATRQVPAVLEKIAKEELFLALAPEHRRSEYQSSGGPICTRSCCQTCCLLWRLMYRCGKGRST